MRGIEASQPLLPMIASGSPQTDYYLFSNYTFKYIYEAVANHCIPVVSAVERKSTRSCFR